jgi:hypothetical protein
VSTHEFEWRMLGACRGLEPSIFYPDDDDEADVAKQVCEQCGVRAACLEHALSVREARPNGNVAGSSGNGAARPDAA